MRVAIFTETYVPQINGVATSTFNLVKILKANGHDVLLVKPNLEDGNKVVYKDGILNLPGVIFKHLYGYRMSWLYNRKAAKIIKDFKPDLIHNQGDAGVGIFARIIAKKYKIPSIYTYHTQYEDYTYYLTKGHFDRLARGIVRQYSRYLAEFNNGIICPSYKTKEMLRTYGVDTYLDVVPTGIDFSLFKEDKQNKEEIARFKKEHNIDEDTYTFISLGRVATEKSIDVCVKGYSCFIKKYPNIKSKLLIVGDGPARTSLELLVHDLELEGKVDFIGAVPPDKVAFYYNCANCFVCASITETQGLTFMESMAANNIVLTRYDDNLTNIIEDGKTGYFFTTPETFADKAYEIVNLTKEEKETILNTAYKNIDMYTIERFYENIIGVYNRVIKNNW